MENNEAELTDFIVNNPLYGAAEEDARSIRIMYTSRNKFLNKYGFSACIFDRYIDDGLIPFHRQGKVIEIEEFSTLAILKRIENENAAANKEKKKEKTETKKQPVAIKCNPSLTIRRKKLNA